MKAQEITRNGSERMRSEKIPCRKSDSTMDVTTKLQIAKIYLKFNGYQKVIATISAVRYKTKKDITDVRHKLTAR